MTQTNISETNNSTIESEQDKVIAIARTWINTPWKHAQRKKGLGVDCINFLAGIAEEVGYDIPPIPKRYARVAFTDGIKEYLDNSFKRKTSNTIEKTNILLFQFSGYNTHVGIASSENTMIHASVTHKKVIEHPIDGVWYRILKGVWELR